MENLLEIMNEVAIEESAKTDDKELQAEFQALQDFVSDMKVIEQKAEALNISLDQFAGTPTERETIEAKIYALKVILSLLSFEPAKLNT